MTPPPTRSAAQGRSARSTYLHHVYRKLATKFKVGVLRACTMLRFTCYYARIMLDAFVLLLHCIPENILA